MKKTELETAINTLTALAEDPATDASIRLQAAQSILSYAHLDIEAATGGQPMSLPPSNPPGNSAAGTQPPTFPGVDPNMASGPSNTDEPSEPTVPKKKPAKKSKKS